MALTRILKGLALAAAALGLLAAQPSPGQAQSVDEIVKKGKLVVGVLTDLPPFGVVGSNGEPDGYDPDVAKLMGKYMGVPVELVPVTGPNRIPYLLTNRVDVLVATFGITPERAKQVSFSIPYGSIDIIVAAAKSKAISKPDDLAGTRIAVARASTQDTAITAMAPKTATIQRFDDDATAAQAYLAGQVDVLGSNNVIVSGIAKDNPKLELERKIVLRRQYQGITMRKSATDLLQWTNTFLYFIKNNGELDAIYRKWLNEPMPEIMPTF
jgi:polar amino acid transport system substrate-binding protein